MAVVQVILNIQSTDLPSIQEAMCARYNLNNTVANAKLSLSTVLLEITAQYQANKVAIANQAAVQSAVDTAKAIIIT